MLLAVRPSHHLVAHFKRLTINGNLFFEHVVPLVEEDEDDDGNRGKEKDVEELASDFDKNT